MKAHCHMSSRMSRVNELFNLPRYAFPCCHPACWNHEGQAECQHANTPPQNVPGHLVIGTGIAPFIPRNTGANTVTTWQGFAKLRLAAYWTVLAFVRRMRFLRLPLAVENGPSCVVVTQLPGFHETINRFLKTTQFFKPKPLRKPSVSIVRSEQDSLVRRFDCLLK